MEAIYGKKIRAAEALLKTQAEKDQLRKSTEIAYQAKYGRLVQTLGNRNYTLFAVLSNVRNNNGIRPLPFSENGVPEDPSPGVEKNCSLNDSDLHSHTYFTLEDLLAVDPNEIAEDHSEVILFADQYQIYKETGKAPEDAQEYPWDHSEETREVTPEEMTMLLMSNDVKKLAKRRKSKDHDGEMIRMGPYVKVVVPRSYKQIVPMLFEVVVPELQKLGKPDAVRVVIAYDN